VLAVTASDDPVAPPHSVSAMLDVVGSQDKAWIQACGSHLALVIGEDARQRLWPAISRWLASYDPRGGARSCSVPGSASSR
jgi:poly(3-hydroxyalkanoate) synthetase